MVFRNRVRLYLAATVVATACVAGWAQAGAGSPGAERVGTGARTCMPGPGVNCAGVRHRWRFEHHGDLRRASFRGADLRGADLRDADLRHADLRGANLRHADLRGARLAHADFSPMRTRGARGARAHGLPPAGGLNLLGPACTPNCMLVDLSGADLSNTLLYKTSFVGANLTGANLSGSVVQLVDMASAQLRGVSMRGATVSYVRISSQEFPADLTGADISNAQVSYVSLAYSDMTNADVSNSAFSFVDLQYANVANLSWAGLTCTSVQLYMTANDPFNFSGACGQWGVY